MIISASRRTDIPACYANWFFNRLEDQEVFYLNPFNRKHAFRVSLKPEDVTCFVFWTKNPLPMLKKLDKLSGYNYYFYITINSYEGDLEPAVSKIRDDIIQGFKTLSKRLGKHRLIWRYDPIVVNDKYSESYHIEHFAKLAESLSDYTTKCIISFVDLYRTAKRNQKEHSIHETDHDIIHRLSEHLSDIAKRNNLQLETCSEAVDLTQYGIKNAKCVDGELIANITNRSDFNTEKDKNQRKECGCIKSIDIGAYNSCKHKCPYCYANYNESQIDKNIGKHNPNSKLLVGELNGDEKIFDVKPDKPSRNLFNLS
ncbi:MAG: DUF1848 domain-containing protein [bacterium]